MPGDMRLPLVDAECKGCSHKSKSRYSEHYRCTACYSLGSAREKRRQAAELRERADRYEAEAEVHEERAREFMERHPGAGVSV